VPLSSFVNSLVESGAKVVDANGVAIAGATVTLNAVY
jgi:hypothetical protein